MGHRNISKHMTAVAVLVFAFVAVNDALAKVPQTDEERQAALKALTWKRGGTFHLDGSRISLEIAPKYSVLVGADARSLEEIINGVSSPDNIEAIVVDPKTLERVVFFRFNEGYVRFDDWNEVNSDQMLQEMKDNTAESNKERVANHVAALNVVGWRQNPTLDRDTQTVQWSIDARSGKESVINAVLLTFGRYGYEKLTWVGAANQDEKSFLADMRTAVNFDSGAKYSDFKQGDKVAGYSIAALIAAAVGAKVAAKVGLLTVFAVFLKKIGIVIAAAVAAALRYVKKLFGRKDSKPAGSDTSTNSGGTPTS